MAHVAQMNYVNFIKTNAPEFFTNCKVLEIGSYNVNGSVRCFFNNCNYTGLDVCSGKDVDIVCSGHEYKSNEKFDTIISCEAFEHNMYWVETFNNMIELCKSGGLIILTCATTGRKEHGTKRTNTQIESLSTDVFGDYYKNLTEIDFRNNIDMSKFRICKFFVNNVDNDLYFYGFVK